MLNIVIIENDDTVQITMPAVPVIQANIQQGAVLSFDAYPSTTVNITTPGPQGIQGTPGDSSFAAETRYVTFNQSTPSSAWLFTHDLANPRPDVNVLDSNGDEMFGDVSYPTTHQVLIKFAFATTGVVQLG